MRIAGNVGEAHEVAVKILIEIVIESIAQTFRCH